MIIIKYHNENMISSIKRNVNYYDAKIIHLNNAILNRILSKN